MMDLNRLIVLRFEEEYFDFTILTDIENSDKVINAVKEAEKEYRTYSDNDKLDVEYDWILEDCLNQLDDSDDIYRFVDIEVYELNDILKK